MHTSFLRFGPKRSPAGPWMAGQARWIRQGVDDGSFLVTGLPTSRMAPQMAELRGRASAPSVAQ